MLSTTTIFFSTPTMFIVIAAGNIITGVTSFLGTLGTYLKLLGWDVTLTLLNVIAYPLMLYRSPGKVTPKGAPGFGGNWIKYIPP